MYVSLVKVIAKEVKKCFLLIYFSFPLHEFAIKNQYNFLSKNYLN